MDPEPAYIEKLHDKFFHGTITMKEKQILFNYFKKTVCTDGKIYEDIIGEFLFVTHPDYGKPDKDGIVRII